MDEAQPVREERLLVLQNQRQVGAGETQVPQATACGVVRKVTENRVMAGGQCALVQFRAGLGLAYLAGGKRQLSGVRQQRDTPTVIVNLAEIPEIRHLVHAQDVVEAQVESRCRVSQ